MPICDPRREQCVNTVGGYGCRPLQVASAAQKTIKDQPKGIKDQPEGIREQPIRVGHEGIKDQATRVSHGGITDQVTRVGHEGITDQATRVGQEGINDQAGTTTNSRPVNARRRPKPKPIVLSSAKKEGKDRFVYQTVHPQQIGAVQAKVHQQQKGIEGSVQIKAMSSYM